MNADEFSYERTLAVNVVRLSLLITSCLLAYRFFLHPEHYRSDARDRGGHAPANMAENTGHPAGVSTSGLYPYCLRLKRPEDCFRSI
jgi:hypothetical protein